MRQLPHNWKLEDAKLVREFTFSNFTEALAFINKIGGTAEKLNHHPEIYNAYNKVRLTCWTHDAGAVTIQDYGLAEGINSCYEK